MNKLSKSILVALGLIIGLVFFYDAGATMYNVNGNDVYLKITTNTTNQELAIIQKELEQDQNITLDFSQSKFNSNGKIQELDMAIDCHDGNAGHLNIHYFGLLIGNHGFSREQDQNGYFNFKVGGI